MTILYPDVIVEFSPTTDVLESPSWEVITDYLRSFSIGRGRSRELDRTEAGTAQFELDDHLGYFDPTNAASPYWPGIKPMRQVRVSADLGSRWAPFTVGSSTLGSSDVLGGDINLIVLFSGFVEKWEQQWTPEPSPHTDATTTLHAVDAFKILTNTQRVADTAGQTGPTFSVILDEIGWPVDQRTFEEGGYEVSATANGSTLAALQELDVAEGGMLFVSRTGIVTFYNASHVRTHPPTDVQAWGDLQAENQYQSIDIETDEASLWNDVTVTGTTQTFTASDDVSQEHYGIRSSALSTALVFLQDCEQRAWEQLARYSTPRQQVTNLEVGVRDDLDWRAILTHDLLDRVVVRRRPIPGHLIEQDSVIQGITITSPHRTRWSIVWALSSTPTDNRLTANQADLETDTTGWVAVSNCSIARMPAIPGGGHWLELTPNVNGTMSAETTPNTQNSVVVGTVYSAMAGFREPSATPTAHVEIVWRNSGGTELSTSAGNTVAVGSALQFSAATGVAPASAAFATVRVVVAGALVASASPIRVDKVGFVNGEQTGWSPGEG